MPPKKLQRGKQGRNVKGAYTNRRVNNVVRSSPGILMMELRMPLSFSGQPLRQNAMRVPEPARFGLWTVLPLQRRGRANRFFGDLVKSQGKRHGVHANEYHKRKNDGRCQIVELDGAFFVLHECHALADLVLGVSLDADKMPSSYFLAVKNDA